MLSKNALSTLLPARLPLISAAAVDKRAGKTKVELSTHYDVLGYTKNDECGRRQGLEVGTWSDILQVDSGKCGYALYGHNAHIIAMPADGWSMANCGKEVELFKPDGFKVNFDGKPLIYGDLCPGCGPNRLDVSVPLLWHLDKNPCIKPLQGYSYTVTNNQVIKGGGNAGTFGCVDGIEQESLKKAQEEARVYRASHKPVVNTNTGTGSVTSGVGSGGIKCGDGDLEGCSGGKRYICDYTAAGKVWRQENAPCQPGAKNF